VRVCVCVCVPVHVCLCVCMRTYLFIHGEYTHAAR
jgi:hypothetical protein